MHAKPDRQANRPTTARLDRRLSAAKARPRRRGFSLIETVIALALIVGALSLLTLASQSSQREAREAWQSWESASLADALAEDLRLSTRDPSATTSAIFGIAPLPGDAALAPGQTTTLHLGRDWQPAPANTARFQVEIRWIALPDPPESFQPAQAEIRVRHTRSSAEPVGRLVAIAPLSSR